MYVFSKYKKAIYVLLETLADCTAQEKNEQIISPPLRVLPGPMPAFKVKFLNDSFNSHSSGWHEQGAGVVEVKARLQELLV